MDSANNWGCRNGKLSRHNFRAAAERLCLHVHKRKNEPNVTFTLNFCQLPSALKLGLVSHTLIVLPTIMALC